MSEIHVVRPGNASGGLVFGVLFALTSLSPAPVYGQGAIEEILVTARKREENLQDIPLTVSAFTAAALQERGIAALQDVADFTPGFDFAHAFGRQDFRPSIRGQSNILGRANAGLFIDGVIVEEGNASVPLAALQRVEVVKGPQSALYGRSTLAGAVNYVLKKPGDEFQGEVHAEYGERDQVQVAVHASGPVSEALGIAVTASHYQRDGEYDNYYAGNSFGTPAINDEVGGEETSSFTAVLSLDPSDRFSLTAFAMYEDSDDEQYAIALQPASFNNCHQVTRGGPLAQPAPPAGTPEAQANFVASAGYNGSGYYCGRVDVDDVLEANGGDGRTNLETSFYDDMGLERESLRLSLKLDFDLTEAFTLTSVTGYSDVDTGSRADRTFGAGGDTRFPVVGVGSPFAVQGFGVPPSVEARVGFVTINDRVFDDFSQELRLSYDDGGASRYLLGYYYYESDFNEYQTTSFDTTTSRSAQGVPLFSPFNPRFVSATISTSAFYEGAPPADLGREKIDSWSIFGSMEFDFTDKVTVRGEFRYNEDDFDFNRPSDNVQAKGSFSAFLPKVTAKYKATEDLMVYANIAKGNKPGTLNLYEGAPLSDLQVDEETAWSYELGFKSVWLDNRAKFNAALYHIDWENLQLTTARAAIVNGQPRTFSVLENVGNATITGVELEFSLSVTEFWDAYLGYAWTDSEIDRFVQSVDANADAPSSFREAALLFGYSDSGDVVISGTQLPQSSKHQLNLSNSFYGKLSDAWSWFLRADFNYNSKRYAQAYNLAHTGNREIVNLRGGVKTDNIDLEVWVDNAFDNDDPTQLIRYVEGSNLTFNPFNRAIGVTLPEGRRVGVTARYRF